MSAARQSIITGFLEAAGWGAARIAPLAGDASRRRYMRLTDPRGRRAVLMDAPPHPETRTEAFLALTDWLLGAGFSAPAILARDAATGLVLLEDLGDGLYADVLRVRPESELSLYSAAVDLLADLDGMPDGLRPYDTDEHLREARLAVEWYVPGATGAPLSSDARAAFDGLVRAAVARPAAVTCRIVLRDYHAENLIWRPERRGVRRVCLLDYQDALAGHPAYDLMSLLEDARRDTSGTLREAMIRHFLDRRPELDEAAFRADYAALAAVRNLKIVGIFARLALRDGKARYLDFLPRVWDHLLRDLAHPDLAPLQGFVERHLPAPDRSVRDRIVARASREMTA